MAALCCYVLIIKDNNVLLIDTLAVDSDGTYYYVSRILDFNIEIRKLLFS